MKIKNYTPEFREVLTYCGNNNLFAGEGNPNSKILIVGKEINGGSPDPNDDPLAMIKKISKKDVADNIRKWMSPDGYDLCKLKSDVLHRDLRSKRRSRNPTWSNYQKLVDGIIRRNLGRDNYDFLDHCFMTELSDIHLPNSNYHKIFSVNQSEEIDRLRHHSVQSRAKLLSMPFFRNFPIVIMACGDYPKLMGFDIEKTFDVKWTGKTEVMLKWVGETEVPSKGNYYNEHNADGRILVHTRQASDGISDKLLNTIAKLCLRFHGDYAE